MRGLVSFSLAALSPLSLPPAPSRWWVVVGIMCDNGAMHGWEMQLPVSRGWPLLARQAIHFGGEICVELHY